MTGSEVRRSVEGLAQTLYEGSDPSGIPWARRGQAVREPWLQVARKQLAQSGNRAEPSDTDGS